jgi:hypothetical protein
MIQIKKFIDKVSYAEARQVKDLVMPIADARGLRDELAKLLADQIESVKNAPEEVIEIKVTGGRF